MHVLFALGPGESSLDAFETALGRATEAGDDLTVGVFGDTADRERLANRATDRLAEADLAADVRELDSDPAPRLVELAEREGVDRIALSAGQRSPLGKIQLDGVTEFVLLNATMSVTLIR